MRKRFKMLLWFLILAVPVQGFAASAMLFCKPAHSHGAAQPAAADTGHHHHSAQQSSEGVAAVSDSHQHHHSPAGDAGHPAQATGVHDMGKCSACASCCVGVALMPTFGDTVSSQPASSPPLDLSTVHFAGFIPAGLERPPRRSLI